MHPRILVIRFGSLGDLILSSAAVINLRIAYPAAHITYLTKRAYLDVVRMIAEVDEPIGYDDSEGTGGLIRTALDLDRRNYDIVVDLHRNARSWAVTKAVVASRKARYPKRRWERMMATRRFGKRLPAEWPHSIDLYNAALNNLGINTPATRPVLRVPKQADLDANGPAIALAPGASFPPKQYPLERFLEVADALRTEYQARLTWIVTEYDAEALRNTSKFDERKERLLIQRPIPELASVLATQHLTIANDSGLMHLSSAVGTPVIGLFGPTHPVLGFAPRGQFDRVVDVDEWCRPCSRHGKRPCFRGEQFCFTRLSTDKILEVVDEILTERMDLAPAVFVDRDGTIIVDKHFLSDSDQVEFESGAVEGLRMISDLGYKIVVISNQSGVARGMFSTGAVDQVNGRLIEMLLTEGVSIDGCYYCPYYRGGRVPEFSIDHRCRKPAPGMPEEAAAHLGLDLRRSFMIGDKLDDFHLGSVIGAYSILVQTGKGRRDSQLLPAALRSDGARVVPDLAVAAAVIRGLK